MKKQTKEIESTKLLDSKILEIASKVRYEIEKFAIKNRKIGNPVTLCCYCAIASYCLNQTLKKFKFDSSFILGSFYNDFDKSENDHCWVLLNNTIIDITATQFKIKKRIYVVNKESKSYIENLRNRCATRYINENWIYNQTIKENLPEIKEIIKESVTFTKKFILT
jgi:hypothetical protein